MRVSLLSAANNPKPVFGILSLILAPLGLSLVVYFASTTGMIHSRRVILFAQDLLLFLLGFGLVSGIVGALRREHPRWISISGLIQTLSIIASIAAFFASLDD